VRKRLGIAALVSLLLVLADLVYWGWLLNQGDATDLPLWQGVFDAVTFFGGILLFAFAVIVTVAEIALRLFGPRMKRPGAR
jgi:hypothetical protein